MQDVLNSWANRKSNLFCVTGLCVSNVLPEFLVLPSFVVLDIKSLCHSLTQKVSK